MVDLPEIVVTPDTPSSGSPGTSPGNLTGVVATPGPTGPTGQPSNPQTPSDPLSQLQAPKVQSRFPPSEIAILEVNAGLFTDWESIWLQHRWLEEFAHFRFIAAERMPPPADWQLLQFKPDDTCTVWLAGQIALTGMITQRQVAYDANRHQVQLIGKSRTFWGYKSSVDTPTNNFDNKTLSQVFTEVTGKYGSGLIIGVVNSLPFTDLQAVKGEATWDFLERACRLRNALIGCDAHGNFLLIGDHAYQVTTMLKEGVNIKACECVISHDDYFNQLESVGQTKGTDQSYGSAANELKCPITTTFKINSKLITPIEEAVAGRPEVCEHAYNTARWHIGTEITANIVVYGWTYNGVNLWAAGMDVYVESPMIMINMVLKVRTVTFEQNDRVGTQTTLECVAPWLLLDAPLDISLPGTSSSGAPSGQGGIGHA